MIKFIRQCNIFRRLREVERKANRLSIELDQLKRGLEQKRVMNFVWVKEYNLFEDIPVEGPPPPIGLEDLQERIEALEKEDRWSNAQKP